jgi:hypothetical protein
MKTFSLDEAQMLLPVLDSLLKNAQQWKQKAEGTALALHQLNQRIFVNGGTLLSIEKVARQRAEQEHAVQRVKDAIAEIDAIGVQLKDLDNGLLDFPCRLGDEVVLLCWKMGEAEITHWHTVDAGFAGRQAIDERFRRSPRQKPN